jgi:hypothetical protein
VKKLYDQYFCQDCCEEASLKKRIINSLLTGKCVSFTQFDRNKFEARIGYFLDCCACTEGKIQIMIAFHWYLFFRVASRTFVENLFTHFFKYL